MLLNCHTDYSFGYGTYHVQSLLTDAQSNGYHSLAITDINNTSAVLDTLRMTKDLSIHVAVGIDFRNGIQQQYVGLAQNNEGFYELNNHLSNHLHHQQPFDYRAPQFNHTFIIYPFSTYKGWPLQAHEYLGVALHDIQQLLISPYKHLYHKLVILHEVSFAGKLQFNMHRLLRCIHSNSLLSKLPPHQYAKGNEMIIPKSLLESYYAAYPHIIKNTNYLLQQCHVNFEYGKLTNKNKRYYTQSTRDDMALLRAECEKGLVYRFTNQADLIVAQQRMENELAVIEEMHFASYFLINWDIVKYAKHKQYYHVGRGSGANSLVAYLIGITDVDPMELDLYFERFINKYRSNAPDFDIDFSWRDRDDITRYIFERFNSNNNVALLGTYSTFQNDAVIQELGKVLGFPPAEIQQLKKLTPQYSNLTKYDKNNLTEVLFYYAKYLTGMPSHLSIHASGILISEQPITRYSATFIPPKGYPTTQFSMLEAEDIGLYKFDILSQRGLGKIKDALSIIQQNAGVTIDIHEVKKFKEDEKVKQLLRKGNTVGCFYVESPGMRMLLAKLNADDYLRLVAASSIIRPGVAQSGMMREYINRYRNVDLREQAKAKLPELYQILEETYGVMVYQEDVIKVAHQFAGLTLAEADYLRRGMSWKFKQRNEFFKVRDQFFNNCLQRGYPLQTVSEIWTQIESFANFAFAKGHSASYAVESYQAMYLKAYFPLEYMVATINNGGGFYRAELYVHEARMHGGIIHPPCINHSNAECVIKGKHIYLGLSMIAELTEHAIKTILQERQTAGAYLSLHDFIKRVAIGIEQLRLLIRAGCFAFTQQSKKELLWQAHALIQPVKRTEKVALLFDSEPIHFELPQLTSSPVEDAFDEIELFGFSLHNPFLLLRDSLPSTLTARNLYQYLNQQVSIVGYLIAIKYTQTHKKERMCFGTFIDTEGHWIDTVHFPDVAKSYPFTGNGCYHIKGKVTAEYDFITIEVSYLKRLPVVDREQLQEVMHEA